MAQPGWYPDPDGTPGRLRWFDGTTWTDRTGDAGPGATAAPPGPPPRRRWWLPVGVAVVVVAVVIAAIAWWPRGDADQSDPGPSSTRSSYDDGSTPTPTPTASPSGRSPSPSPSASDSGRPVACDLASPDQDPAPPDDGRVHGGPLSFPRLPAPWSSPEPTGRVPYSRDSQVQVLRLPEKLPWQASVQIGVATFSPYPGGAEATSEMLQCVLTSDFYTGVDVTLAENEVRSITVDGHRATERDALLTFHHPLLKTRGSRLRFVVVESDPVSYLFSAVPMERADLVTDVDRVTRSLTVS